MADTAELADGRLYFFTNAELEMAFALRSEAMAKIHYVAYQNKRFWLKIAYSDKLFEIIFGYLGKFLYFCSEKNFNHWHIWKHCSESTKCLFPR